MGLEPTTSCLGSRHSTTELRPLAWREARPRRESAKYTKDTGSALPLGWAGPGLVGANLCVRPIRGRHAGLPLQTPRPHQPVLLRDRPG